MTGESDGADDIDPVADLKRRRDTIRQEMGGLAKVARLHAQRRLTAREHIAGILDRGSFREVGMFATSERADEAATTPGDGKIGGHGTIGGRPVSIVADDVTVKRASSSAVASHKIERIYDQARRAGNPFIYVGETGGARLPDNMTAKGYSSEPVFPWLADRRRAIPVATLIVGDSFGGSSFVAGLSDFVVQVQGSCLAITSPRVIEVATGETISMDDLGGPTVHATRTGQIDVAVDDERAGHLAIRRFLEALQDGEPVGTEPDPEMAALVPARRNLGYDMRTVLTRLVDDGDLLELKPDFGPSVITGLGRVDGRAVGIIANQPMHHAGTLTPDGCAKAARLICLCDANDLPIVFVQDTPGFMVGTEVEHDRLLARSMLFLQALVMAGVPKISIVVRKAFGLAFFSMGGPHMGSDLLVAWPGAEIGFMDPAVAENVLGSEIVDADFDPYAVAALMNLDDVIDPADTRTTIAETLQRHRGRTDEGARPLASWPIWW